MTAAVASRTDLTGRRTAPRGDAVLGLLMVAPIIVTMLANDIVNQTLKRNRDRVDEVVSGARYEAGLNERFGFVTGKEAYRLDPDTEPYMRPTYAARVVIQHDSRSDNGYRVLTAFPVNQRPERQ